MSGLDIPMFPTWDVGDTRQLGDRDLGQLLESDAYDSYDQIYVVDRARWKIIEEIHRANGHSEYTLECIAIDE